MFSFRMKNKKSQMELLGMAIVIVLVTIGILFILKFNVLKGPSETKKHYTYSELSSTTLSAMILANSGEECNNINIRDLLIDCTEYFESNGSITCRDGNQSCVYVKKAIMSIFNNTLNKWNRNYKFNTSTPIGTIVNVSRGSCLGERRPQIFYFNTNKGMMFIRLDICD